MTTESSQFTTEKSSTGRLFDMAKRGRKRSSNPKVPAKFRIDMKTLEQIEYMAIELQISRSELVRRAIREFLWTLKKQGIEIPY